MKPADACPSRDHGRHIYRDGFCIFCDTALPPDPLLEAHPPRRTRAQHNARQEAEADKRWRCDALCQVPDGDGCGGHCELIDAHDGPCRCGTCECEWGHLDV